MYANNLQQNLKKIIKQRNLQIVEVERKAGLKKNSVYNIIKGISKNPSAQNLKAIAQALGISTESLYDEKQSKNELLSKEDLDLILKLSAVIISQINQSNLNITFSEYAELLSKMFEYNNISADESNIKFANWLLLNKK